MMKQDDWWVVIAVLSVTSTFDSLTVRGLVTLVVITLAAIREIRVAELGGK